MTQSRFDILGVGNAIVDVIAHTDDAFLNRHDLRKGAMTLIIDSGIRRGTDVLKALALGADFVFIGRPFMFAAAIGGTAGVVHAARILKDEIERDMALLGVNQLSELTPALLQWVPNPA